MKNELKNIEKELKNLVPRKPNDALKSSIIQKLARPQQIYSRNYWQKPLTVAASLVILIGISFQLIKTFSKEQPQDSISKASSINIPDKQEYKHLHKHIFRPTRMQTVVLKSDNTIIESAENKPLNCEKRQLLDHIEWISLDKKRKITITKPRKEILLTRLSSI